MAAAERGMQARVWLRIAALLAGLFAAAHTAGRPWTPSQDVLAQGVVAAMRSVHFTAVALTRSYYDFYQSFGLTVSVFLATEGVLLWQLATLAGQGGRVRPAALTHAGAFLLLAVIAARYVFAIPVALSLAIAVCAVVAAIRSSVPSASH